MAGGEKAKKSGEYGEAIVKNLLDLFGWDNYNANVTVPCVFSEKHSNSQNEKSEKHGIDYVYKYMSPLRNTTQQDILISVKCRDGYPKTEKTVTNKFKEFFLDIIKATECYPSCDISKQKIHGATNRIYSSLIFWIDRNTGDGRENESVIEKITGFHLSDTYNYDTVALIDNSRAQFLYTSINYARNKYGKENCTFFYINTGLNNANLRRKYNGTILPFEYLNSDILPMAIEQSDQKRLLLLVKDKFCKEYLLRLIGLAQELTSNWAANITIAFPDYNEFRDKEDVSICKANFDDYSFTNKINIVTYNPDFRDEV